MSNNFLPSPSSSIPPPCWAQARAAVSHSVGNSQPVVSSPAHQLSQHRCCGSEPGRPPLAARRYVTFALRWTAAAQPSRLLTSTSIPFFSLFVLLLSGRYPPQKARLTYSHRLGITLPLWSVKFDELIGPYLQGWHPDSEHAFTKSQEFVSCFKFQSNFDQIHPHELIWTWIHQHEYNLKSVFH